MCYRTCVLPPPEFAQAHVDVTNPNSERCESIGEVHETTWCDEAVTIRVSSQRIEELRCLEDGVHGMGWAAHTRGEPSRL